MKNGAGTEKGTANRKGRPRKSVRIPLSWRALAVAAVVPVGIAIFYFGVHRAGVTVPISEKDRDPIFFSFLFAVTVPAFLYAVIRAVMAKVLLRKSSAEIGKEVAKDVAAAVAVAVVDGLTGSSGSSSPGSSSSGGTKGGGGEFGGGGSSGSY